MSRKNDFSRAISEWFTSNIPEIKNRDMELPENIPVITSIIGPRRSGKTYLMYKLIKKLLNKIPKYNILYINFENEYLINLDARDLDDLLESYYEIAKPDFNNPVYLFFDEIQVVRNWNLWINKIYETKKYHIYLTGSSSKLLSRELSTELRGRSIDFLVFPLSFKEFLEFNNFSIEKPGMYIKSPERGKIINYLNEYLKYGGFPEICLMHSNKEKLLKSYADTMVIKDVGERFHIEPSILNVFFNYCISLYSKYFTGNKTYNYLKSLNFKISHDLPNQLLYDFTEVFSIFKIDIYSKSNKSKNQYPKKIYIVDSGIINIKSDNYNIGRLMENTVFLDLEKKSESMNLFNIYYWKQYGKSEGLEVDFVIYKNSVKFLINITYASSGCGTLF